jgi:hypothetical protein
MSGTLPIRDLVGAWLESGELAEHALAHVRRGWAVFPLAPKSKVPLIAKRFGGRGCHDATREPAQVTKWWAECPHANIGIATGAPSGFFVLDVDPRHDGDKTLSALIQQHGPLPDTIVSLTGGGGRHFLSATSPASATAPAGLAPGSMYAAIVATSSRRPRHTKSAGNMPGTLTMPRTRRRSPPRQPGCLRGRFCR